MTEALLRDIVAEIRAAADELLAKQTPDMLEQGQLLAYAEALCIIQDVAGVERRGAIGLDFDVDEVYLGAKAPGDRSPVKKEACPCCGKSYVEEHDICSVCSWQNDPVQTWRPDMGGGANRMSLKEAIEAYENGRDVV